MDEAELAVADSFEDPQERPGRPEAGHPITKGGTAMPGRLSIFAPAADDMYGRAVTFQPEGMLEFIAQMETLSGPLVQVAAAVTLLASKASSEFPLNPAVGEQLAQVGAGMARAAAAADEIGPLIRKLHTADLERLEKPRAGEHMWDVRTNNQR
jgi:hypothetical protein